MAISEYQINEIKNINLIYVFSVDSIFKNNTKKYIGIKVVYGDNCIIETDYTDPKFQDLIKRIVDRYQNEKDTRHIILLGPITKKVMNDLSFDILKQQEDKHKQIPYFTSTNGNINRYIPYIEELIYFVVDKLLKYNTFKIQNIKGYNHNYMINYTIAGNVETTGMIIYEKEEKICFQIGIINGLNDNISGVVMRDNGLMQLNFNYNSYNGYIKCDVHNNCLEKHIDVDNETYYHDDIPYEISNNERNLVDYYLSIFGYDKSVDLLKVNNNLFLANKIKKINDDNQILFNNRDISIYLSKDEIRIIEISREGFSKYEGIINTELDKKVKEVIIRKLNIDGNNIIVIEKNDNDNYEYEIITKSIDLMKPFNLGDIEKVEANTIDDIKRFVRKRLK